MSTTLETRTIPFGKPWITDQDRQAVAQVLEGTILTHGPRCLEFEKAFATWMGPDAHCVSVSSGMAALHLSYLHFGIQAGDEVIVPAMTHIATVHAVQWVGATPVFVDADPATGNITAELIQAAITEKTKAISLVHFQGIPCNMDEIMQVANQHHLRVIEDCALAVGAKYDHRHVGLFGDTACFSFYPVKHITAGEGGMFATRHSEVARAVAQLRAFGVDRRHDQRVVPGMYDVPQLGLNYRMSEMQAALGISQLTRVEEILARRQRNFQQLKEALLQLENVRVLDAQDSRAQNSYYGLTMVLEGPLSAHRDAIILRLREAGVGTSIYYPQPVPRMTYYREKFGYNPAHFPVATAISDHSVALPVGPHLEPDDVSYISQQVSNVLSEVGS